MATDEIAQSSHAPQLHEREPTIAEIATAGAPNYSGRSLHPQVHIDGNGLMYIGQVPHAALSRKSSRSRTVSVPVKLVAFAEQGQEQYHISESDPRRDRLELVVGPEVLLVQWHHVCEDTRKLWLSVPAPQVSDVKVSRCPTGCRSRLILARFQVTVNRWRDGQEGSDALIAVFFETDDHRT